MLDVLQTPIRHNRNVKRPVPAWIIPVIAILVLQTTTSFLSRLIPIISPVLTQEFGWNGSLIGYLTTANTVGALLILVAGAALIRYIGGIRTVQIGLLLGAISVVLFFFPSITLALVASFMIGLSYGAASPAGSEILQRFSPPESRNLVFSIKQAGVPLGGVIAGLAVPPLVELTGWRITLLIAAVFVIGITCLTWRLSARVDEPTATQKTFAWSALLSARNVAIPLRSLARGQGSLKLSMAGSLLAATQSCWFTFSVIYLVERLDLSLNMAGLVFAVMQATGVVGRITLGWIADRSGSATLTLSLAAIGSSITTALLGFSTSEWPLWAIIAIAAAAGATAASWNGVQIAEVARRSPAGMVTETAAGSAILIYMANMIAPAAFAAFVAATGHFDQAFLAAAVCSLLSLAFLMGVDKQTKAVGNTV
ncbi:MFS transporter [Paralcaligenes ginsengisoli]